MSVGTATPRYRMVHFTDLHYRGDRRYVAHVVAEINARSPDFVCFTGDIVEEAEFLEEALDLLSGIRSPKYGVPGNHEYWSGVSYTPIAQRFAATGGCWLVDEEKTTADGALSIFGSAGQNPEAVPEGKAAHRLLLTHYPILADQLGQRRFDLILAGHSHGGQVRIPRWGPLVVPFGVGRYSKGLYQTQAGPLYVNPGIGWWRVPVRFCCRPELTVIEF